MPMNQNPLQCPHCRRLSYRVGLTLAMLGLTLALCALLMGCAGPCHPTLGLAKNPPMAVTAGTVDCLGISCEWMY